MKVTQLIVGLVSLAAVLSMSTPGRTQTVFPPELKNSQISIVYEPTSGFLEAKAQLQQSEVLERLAKFLSPFKWPRPMTLRAKFCGDENLFFESRDSSEKPGTPEAENSALVVCYEFFADLLAKASRHPGGFSGAEYAAGALTSGILHEVGHAAFHHFEVPVLGREEDAADQFASYLILQFRPELAVPTITLQALISSTLGSDEFLLDEHGTPSQRFFNSLCIAYGADPARFAAIADAGQLPPERRKNCGNEYRQIARAFNETILPHIDPAMMKKVREVNWLPELFAP